MNLAAYSKFWVALAGALVAFAASYFGNTHVFQLIVGLLTAAGVYNTRNTPSQDAPDSNTLG